MGVHRRRDFPEKVQAILAKYFPKISLKEIKKPQSWPMPKMTLILPKYEARARNIWPQRVSGECPSLFRPTGHKRYYDPAPEGRETGEYG